MRYLDRRGQKANVQGQDKNRPFFANAALFDCARLTISYAGWAAMSGSPTLRQCEPKRVRTYLVREAGKLLTENRQLTVKTPDNDLYPHVWNDCVAVDLGS